MATTPSPVGVKKFGAGSLRYFVALEEDVGGATDTYGEGSSNWQIVEWSWADIRPLSGEELINARQIQPHVTHTLIVRHPSKATEGMRFRISGSERAFHIEAIFEDGGIGRLYNMLCREPK